MQDFTEQQRQFILRLLHAMEETGAVVVGEHTLGDTFTAQVYCVDTQSQTGRYDFALSLRLELVEE